MKGISRRSMMQKTGVLASSSVLPYHAFSANKKTKHKFTFCLNTSTIRGQELNIVEEIKTAAEAGYDGVEIWMNRLQDHLKNGGTTKEILDLSRDLNIAIEDCISFAEWIVDDPKKREAAYQQTRKEMELLAEVGCKRIAAPPYGATKPPSINLSEAAERYHDILNIGQETGVLPQLELWGFSHNLHLFGEVMFIASEAAHSDACILPDVYHLYKGGSAFESLRMIDPSAIHMFHLNDYPADPPRAEIGDGDRVYPGDGVAPLDTILQLLNAKNKPIVLSLELFNKTYYKKPAIEAAKEGLEKMKRSVDKALA